MNKIIDIKIIELKESLKKSSGKKIFLSKEDERSMIKELFDLMELMPNALKINLSSDVNSDVNSDSSITNLHQKSIDIFMLLSHLAKGSNPLTEIHLNIWNDFYPNLSYNNEKLIYFLFSSQKHIIEFPRNRGIRTNFEFLTKIKSLLNTKKIDLEVLTWVLKTIDSVESQGLIFKKDLEHLSIPISGILNPHYSSCKKLKKYLQNKFTK